MRHRRPPARGLTLFPEVVLADDADQGEEPVHFAQVQHGRVVEPDDARAALVEPAVIVALQPAGNGSRKGKLWQALSLQQAKVIATPENKRAL